MISIVGTPFVSAQYAPSTSFTLTNGASTGRGVIVLAAEHSAGAGTMSDPTFNGVTGTVLRETSNADREEIVAYFTNAQLPSAAGSYTVDFTDGPTNFAVIEIDGWDQAAPVSNVATLTGPERPTSATQINFAGSGAGGFIVLAATNELATSMTVTPGGTDHFYSSRTFLGSKLDSGGERSITMTTADYEGLWYAAALFEPGPTIQAIRKSSAFDIETTLGTITTATLNAVNVFDHLTAQDATTATFAGAFTDEITTSGEYALVLGDGTVTETVTIQVNVYGVAPSNNPVQKDGAAQASLTGVQVRVTAGANLDGAQLEYLPTATTDASGNLSNIDLSSTAAADADPVLLHMRTSAGDSIISSETVGLL